MGFKRSFNQIARESIETGFGRIVRGKAAVKTVKDTVKKQAGKKAGKKIPVGSRYSGTSTVRPYYFY